MGPSVMFILDHALDQRTNSFPSRSASVPIALDKVVTQHFLFKTSEPSFLLPRAASQGAGLEKPPIAIHTFPLSSGQLGRAPRPGLPAPLGQPPAPCLAPLTRQVGSGPSPRAISADAQGDTSRCPRRYRPKPETSALRPPPKTPPGCAPLRVVVPET